MKPVIMGVVCVLVENHVAHRNHTTLLMVNVVPADYLRKDLIPHNPRIKEKDNREGLLEISTCR
jgi:hypothetical protein